MFHARFYGVPASDRKARVNQALELAQLESRRKSKVKEFSGGMKRRLAIVRALIHDPDPSAKLYGHRRIDTLNNTSVYDVCRTFHRT